MIRSNTVTNITHGAPEGDEEAPADVNNPPVQLFDNQVELYDNIRIYASWLGPNRGERLREDPGSDVGQVPVPFPDPPKMIPLDMVEMGEVLGWSGSGLCEPLMFSVVYKQAQAAFELLTTRSRRPSSFFPGPTRNACGLANRSPFPHRGIVSSG